ncbi:hypothetical protein [Nocardioides pinisoli]|uniref:Calcium-binding protein n=1 Tax=Nocardioides pinisoli TaxID=2950279 RepID=A0ABT1L1L9_9ACTN|nr:hypothetical protein [Nocardioides pinisoli]MCP3423777.1 hypothetical protein [Nocardioides pinisoli]
MTHRSSVLLAVLALAGPAWLVAAAPGSAAAAPTTCAGKPVTIVATTTVTHGTEGDDVVAMEPGQWNTFDAGAGDDTVCLAAGRADINDRDSRPPAGFLDAGTGDDTVVNLTPSDTTGMIFTTVVLGLGDDSFQGSDIGEEVFAETRTADYDDPYAVDPAFTGSQTDVITSAATVYSAAPNDGANQDQITFGSADARMVIGGTLAPEGRVDVSAAASATLEIRRPSGLRPSAPADVTVDNGARAVTVAGASVLTWTGDFDIVNLGRPQLRPDEPAVSFTGTDASETVNVTDLPIGRISLGDGRDKLFVNSLNSPYIPRTADGGPGRDWFVVFAVCRSLTVRLGAGSACDDVTGDVSDFSSVAVATEVTGSTATLRGTGRGERLSARGVHVVVRGRAGADTIVADGLASARVHAGTGADDVVGYADDLVAMGQGGRDRIEVAASTDPRPADRRQRVALGGAGDDVLVGSRDTRRERLVGGLGKDRADGRKGRRDFCDAEVRLRCERP